MTIKELSTVLEFVQSHHKFAMWKSDEDTNATMKQYPSFTNSMARHGMCIKYVDVCYDTRDMSVWNIKLRGIGKGLVFSCNHFSMLNPQPKHFKFESLFDWVMGYLTCEWTNNVILKQCEVEK